MKPLQPGDYVLATKYRDGDPGDHFYVGFFKEVYMHCGTQVRYIIVDDEGKSPRANGFRRCERIAPKLGKWIVEHASALERERAQPPINLWRFKYRPDRPYRFMAQPPATTRPAPLAQATGPQPAGGRLGRA